MDVKYFKSDSDFLAKKCSRRCNGGVDRISELPDETILVILSFLSLRECVTTSVLSSRWSDLWKHVPNLYLDASLLTNHYQEPIRGSAWDVERCKYIEIVSSVLQSHKAPSLKELRISLYANKSAQCAVAKWLEFVVSRQVERLRLDFLCVGTSDVVSYEELLGDNKVCLPQNLICFKSLKSLCLKGFNVSGEAIESFLRNCPLLEKLYIQYSFLTSDIVVCGTTLALKLLDIYGCYGRPSDKKSIKVCAPNLTWLRVSTTHKLVLENIPKLGSAEYSCAISRPDYVKQFTSAVFSCVSRLENLNLNLRRSKVFLENAFPQMPKLKKLAIRYGPRAYEDGLLPVTALIRASPRLQEFKLKVERPRIFHSTWKNSEKHRHQHLKAFEFTGFCEGAADHKKLLIYILDSCVALEKIIIGCPSLAGAEPRAARDRLEQLLDGEVPDHIQLYIV